MLLKGIDLYMQHIATYNFSTAKNEMQNWTLEN